MIEKTQGRLVRAGGVSRVGANSSKAKERFRFLKSSERVGLGKGLARRGRGAEGGESRRGRRGEERCKARWWRGEISLGSCEGERFVRGQSSPIVCEGRTRRRSIHMRRPTFNSN